MIPIWIASSSAAHMEVSSPRNRLIWKNGLPVIQTARKLTLTAKIYLGSSTADRQSELRAAFEYIGLNEELAVRRKVFVKPNFTLPRPVPGVTTSREVLGDTLRLLAEAGAEVFVGESNGGYGSFTAAEAFDGHGLHELCRQTGAQPVDLSKEQLIRLEGSVGDNKIALWLPRFLVDEVDFTVSIPVLKVHAMTTVSLSMKNLWGCYPTNLRLLEHEQLDRKLALIAEAVKARYGIVDALYGLDEHGPMEGKARFLGKFIASNNLVMLDRACARMMGFAPDEILHLRNLLGLTSKTGELKVVSNEDMSVYNWGFSVRRDFIDSLSFACFHSDLLAKVVFDSPFTRPIYAILGRTPHRHI